MKKAISAVVVCALVGGCNIGDGKVKYHFNPPMSYHTLTFPPVSLDATVSRTYSPREFFKIDKRFRAVSANVIVQATDNTIDYAHATNILANVVVSLSVRDSDGRNVFTNQLRVASVTCRVKQKEPLIVQLGFPGSPFTPEDAQFGSADLCIAIPEGTDRTDQFTAYLEFTEIRGK